MGRPSLTETRRLEILEAFERCIAQYGLAESSLERIAAEAGMKRSILRHFVGNRDALVLALAQHVVDKYRKYFQDYLAAHAELSPQARMLGFLFPSQPISSADQVLVLESLIAESESQPAIAEVIGNYVEDLVTRCRDLLREEYPHASLKQCWSIAYGVISICFNQESLGSLGLPAKYERSARSCAKILVNSLQA